MRMGRKRSSAKGAATVWWLAAVAIALVCVWVVWRVSHAPKTAALPNAPTNILNVAKATNLLHWLNTNTIAPATNIATKPVVPPPPTNRIQANHHLPVPSTNLVTIRTAAPPLFKPPTNVANAPVTNAPAIERPVKNLLEAQIALARLAISAGPIDGVMGLQTREAIRAFQSEYEMTVSGELDEVTKVTLTITEPVFTNYVVTPTDLARLRPLPTTWLEKSQAESLEYETILELVAEKHQSSHSLIKSLNPSVNWTNVSPFTSVKVPNVTRPAPKRKAAFIRIALAAKQLEAFDSDTNLLAHFPCSIAARVEKRPVGQLTVVTGAENPNYTFDPAVFPESEEARQIDHKLIIPPGPNNPVGVAWITLDKPGYGIHGTPRPEQVGRTESHGCFRLANWNAEYLLKLVSAGTTVYVEP
jgi:lipoprotein-anchoring transpeptidase ErfK/SrfK